MKHFTTSVNVNIFFDNKLIIFLHIYLLIQQRLFFELYNNDL